MKRHANTKTQKWILLPYFVLCFYYFGTVMMTYFVTYPQLEKVSKNIHDYMQLFNDKMILFCYFPAVLMILSHVILFFFCSKKFSSKLLWLSFELALFSVITTFWAIVPIHNELPTLGLTAEMSSKLQMFAIYFQIIPAALQVLIALALFNKYLNYEIIRIFYD
jgi:hypothetical protein